MASANAIARKRQAQHNSIIDNQLLIIQNQVEIMGMLRHVVPSQSKPKRGRPKKEESIVIEEIVLEANQDALEASKVLTDAITAKLARDAKSK